MTYNYHQHTGSSAEGSGCYTTPQYHQHTNSCYKTCGGNASFDHFDNNGWTAVYHCSQCGRWLSNGQNEQFYAPNNISCYERILNCNKGNEITGYSLGCGKTTETLESATVIFD